MKKVPTSLKTWFIIHFIVDFVFGLPLLFFPEQTLTLFGFQTAELLTARLVGAALIGIGGTSLLIKDKGIETFNAMLTLKIVWSIAAIIAIILTLIERAPPFTWLILLIFIIFNLIWVYYKRSITQKV